MALLDVDELRNASKGLPDWVVIFTRNDIARRFEFNDFVQAFGFMSQVV